MIRLAVAALLATAAAAQSPQPQPVPLPPPTIAPVDRPYPGTITEHVDATDLDHHIFTVHETVPVAEPGPLTLLYPQWLPGKHAPRGPVDKLAGLIVRAGGQRLEWTRDSVDVYAFHLDIPAGVAAIDLDFQFLSPTTGNQGRVQMTPDMLNLEFDQTTLYPAGYFTRDIPVSATVRFPDGWQAATALRPVGGAPAGEVRYGTVPFETLVDSPIFAGRYVRRVPLDTSTRPVTLDIVADRPDLLAATDEQIAKHAKLVREATTLFGSKHFDHYDFLLALSDKQGGIGLEHHRSSENGSVPGYFTEWDKNPNAHNLLPHEFSHSWDGKFRRGADSWTPNYNVPMRNSLLWVYEGGTQYFGTILGARSGMWSRDQALDVIAGYAATYDAVAGRAWKPLIDTTNDPITASRAPEPWRNWQRSEDYYVEGALIWLDADTLIRERSGGKRSLDDFGESPRGRRVHAVGAGQQLGLGECQCGLGVVRLGGEDSAEDRDRTVEVTVVDEVGGVEEPLVLRLRLGRDVVGAPVVSPGPGLGATGDALGFSDPQHLGEDGAHLLLGDGAGEEGDELTADDCQHRGDRLHLQRGRDPLLGVDIDGRQHEPTGVLVGQALEDRRQLLAGFTPCRPEVEHDGDVGRPVEDLGLEIHLGDLDRERARSELTTRGAPRRRTRGAGSGARAGGTVGGQVDGAARGHRRRARGGRLLRRSRHATSLSASGRSASGWLGVGRKPPGSRPGPGPRPTVGARVDRLRRDDLGTRQGRRPPAAPGNPGSRALPVVVGVVVAETALHRLAQARALDHPLHREIAVERARHEADVAQALVLCRGLEDEMPVTEKPAEHRLDDGDVEDARDRHGGESLGDQAPRSGTPGGW